MRDAISAIVGKKWPDVTIYGLSKALRAASGGLIGGMRLAVEKDRKDIEVWSVRCSSTP